MKTYLLWFNEAKITGDNVLAMAIQFQMSNLTDV